MLFLVAFIWLLNLAISFWNAYAVGTAWVESKHAGGWRKAIAWAVAAMSALGFTWCYMIVAVFAFYAGGKLTIEAAEAALSLGYLIILPGILVSGYMIMFDSWANAYRRRTVGNFGVAGYNTFANLYNTYNAVRSVPDAWGNVSDFFRPKNKDSAQALLVILIVVVALGCGIITTAIIISRVAARDEPLPLRRPEYA